jgi:predicted Zn-dependent protease
VLPKTPRESYARADVCRMLAISDRWLRGWQKQGLIRQGDSFRFSDLIALRALQKLRENRVPTARITRAIESLKKKLAHVEHPLSELKILSNGRSINVLVAGQTMEALTGQMLFDFDTAELNNVKRFEAPAPTKTERDFDETQAELWFQRGLELEERSAPLKEAIEAYERAVTLNPNAAGALVNLGTIYYHLRRFREAQKYYERALAVDPRYPLAHFNMGNLCDECGRLDQAREFYQSALKLSPDYADAHYNMALLCERLGDFLGATRHWKAYLKVDPASSWSQIARRQLEKLRQATVITRREPTA